MKGCSARFCALACLATLPFASPVAAELIYGIAAVGNATNLVTWDSATPTNLLSGTFVSGLQPNETIVGIDFRPDTFQLYALGTTSRLYTLNPTNGAATAVNAVPFAPPLNGFNFGFDFNPMTDRIRVVSETNKNYVLNPDTGLVETVGPDLFFADSHPIFGTDPNVVHIAYSNNRPNAQFTTLYGIDSGRDRLVTINPATGQVSHQGVSNMNGIIAIGGFDISGLSSTAYAVLSHGGIVSEFFSINLITGQRSSGSSIDGGLLITAMTVAPGIPEPTTLALFGIGMIGCIAARRRPT
jgi:hypothetical protein